MSHDWDTGIDDLTNVINDLLATFNLKGIGTGFLHDANGSIE
ncbi:MAG: hypothetical protein BWY72_02380 [Bacteroidetes bacterium ADurb.Bin416]|nr:MAG: hypothetical protein BWY72_02380 [Bacteroidetes bacterium ADurb.Bin416]